nr:hypothetical protein [Tanacetum cinerariifolium]
YSQTIKAYIVPNKEIIRIEESLTVTFDDSLLEPESSPLVEDDRINEPIVQDLNGSQSIQVNVSDEGYSKSVKEARGHLIEQVIVLKTREYELWSMMMEQYLTFIDHALWEVIVDGDSFSSVVSASFEGHIPPKTAEQRLARKNELKAKSTLMLAISDEHY